VTSFALISRTLHLTIPDKITVVLHNQQNQECLQDLEFLKGKMRIKVRMRMPLSLDFQLIIH
jgi:hypothetical protein